MNLSPYFFLPFLCHSLTWELIVIQVQPPLVKMTWCEQHQINAGDAWDSEPLGGSLELSEPPHPRQLLPSLPYSEVCFVIKLWPVGWEHMWCTQHPGCALQQGKCLPPEFHSLLGLGWRNGGNLVDKQDTGRWRHNELEGACVTDTVESPYVLDFS